MPSPLFVAEPTLPRSVEKTYVAPSPAVRSLPNASLRRSVTVEVLDPFATIDVGEALNVDVVSEAAPGLTVTVSLPVIEPLTVSVTVIVRAPAWRSSTPVKVFVPASPPTNG